MIAYTALLLFLIGVFCCAKATGKVDRVISLLSFAAACCIFALFFKGMMVGNEDVFSFVWNTSPSGDIKIDIISNPYNYGLIYPFFIITLLSLSINLFLPAERLRSLYTAVLLFNLVMVILMLTSNNFVQLLAALFITDILALFMIRDAIVGRKYVLMNIFADMLLFMVMAIINSRIKSLDIRQILRYNQIEFYPDFVTICGLTTVFIRFGFFAFHSGICALKETPLHRLLNILFLFSPLSALILLLKFHVVWQNSAYFLPYLNALCVLTIVWGFVESLIIDSYHEKTIYIQMMFWPLMVELLRFNGFVWNDYFTALVLGTYVVLVSLYMLNYYCGWRKKMSLISKTHAYNRSGIVSSMVPIFLSIMLMSDVLYRMYNNSNRYYIWLFAVLFVLSFGTLVKQVCFFRAKNSVTKALSVKFRTMIFVILTALPLIWLSRDELMLLPIGCVILLFVGCCCLSPLSYCAVAYKYSWLQQSDVFGSFYETLVNSARLLGRFLVLLVDRLLIEKFLVKTTTSLVQAIIRLFRKISNSWVAGLFVVLALFVLLLISFYLGSVK